MISDIFKACRKNNLAIPPDITMFLKGVITFEGVVAKIAPEMNIMHIAIPYIKLQMLKEWDFGQEALEQVNNLLQLLKQGPRIPIKLMELMDNTASGKLKVKTEIVNMEKIVIELHKMVNRLVLGIIITAIIIGSCQVIKVDFGPKILNLSAIGFIGYIFMFVLGGWLFASILKSGRMW
jgi:ubiquinone biosynthesis protein